MVKLFCISDSHGLWRNTLPQAHSSCERYYVQVIDHFYKQHPLMLLSTLWSHLNIRLTAALIKINESQFALRTCVCDDVTVCFSLCLSASLPLVPVPLSASHSLYLVASYLVWRWFRIVSPIRVRNINTYKININK